MSISDMFRGRALNAVDSGGRVMLPRDFRATLTCRYRRLVHETGYDPALGHPAASPHPRAVASLVWDAERSCLIGYDDAYAALLLEQIDRRHADLNGQARERAICRDQGVFGASQDVAWDSAGRITLSPRLRARAGIESLVYFFARGLTFELWHPLAFDLAHRSEWPDIAEDCRLDCAERGARAARRPRPAG